MVDYMCLPRSHVGRRPAPCPLPSQLASFNSHLVSETGVIYNHYIPYGHCTASPIHIPLLRNSHYLPAAQHIITMIIRRRAAGGDTCTSAGRVTAHLLLSFLAFSPSSTSAASQPRADDQAVLQLHPDYFQPAPEPPVPAEHTFVSLPTSATLLPSSSRRHWY